MGPADAEVELRRLEFRELFLLQLSKFISVSKNAFTFLLEIRGASDKQNAKTLVGECVFDFSE